MLHVIQCIIKNIHTNPRQAYFDYTRTLAVFLTHIISDSLLFLVSYYFSYVIIFHLSLFPACHYFPHIIISRKLLYLYVIIYCMSLFSTHHYFSQVIISVCHYFPHVIICHISLFLAHYFQ